jgi:hypothetical protein
MNLSYLVKGLPGHPLHPPPEKKAAAGEPPPQPL